MHLKETDIEGPNARKHFHFSVGSQNELYWTIASLQANNMIPGYIPNLTEKILKVMDEEA